MQLQPPGNAPGLFGHLSVAKVTPIYSKEPVDNIEMALQQQLTVLPLACMTSAQVRGLTWSVKDQAAWMAA